MPDTGVREVTEPVEFELVDDRLRVTFISGPLKQTYCLSFHKVRNAIHIAERLLDQREREQRVTRLEERRR